MTVILHYKNRIFPTHSSEWLPFHDIMHKSSLDASHSNSRKKIKILMERGEEVTARENLCGIVSF